LILVIKNNTEHARIELPAITFFDLENLIPEDVKIKLVNRQLDLAKIKFKYLENGLVPGKVFELNDENSSFQVILL
jgi:hypothetical protein